jgi:type IV fimbrial biogenesis protein FimT
MYPIAISRGRAAAGFTLIESLVAVGILGIVLAVGMPRMSKWLLVSRATGATEFYAEGMRMARQVAISHNAASRLRLTDNTKNGQYDWQVDICFPTAVVACTETLGTWSTVTTPAPTADGRVDDFKSIFREAVGLPDTDVLTRVATPAGNTDIYFTAVGWVDTTFPERLTQLTLRPSSSYSADFQPSALTVSLAGIAVKCNPDAPSSDAARCN